MSPTLELEATAYTRQQLLAPDAPQVALAGRSNVGKSSLVNALAGRKALAKVSATPGKTRSVNYYKATPGEYYVVDLPGYGYARCSKAEQEKWVDLLGHYLERTPGLAALVLLIDARISPQKADLQLVSFAAAIGLKLLPVLTKADKCAKKDLAQRQKEWGKILGGQNIMVTSSHTRKGLDELWQALHTAINAHAASQSLFMPADDGSDDVSTLSPTKDTP